MARPRKGPWRRGQNGHWYTTIGRKNVKVADKGDSHDEAFRKYVELLSVREVEPGKITVVVLLDHYLEWVQGNRAHATYLWYQRFTQSFVDHVGKRLKVADLRGCSITRLREAFDHEVDHGDLHERLVALDGSLERLGEAS